MEWPLNLIFSVSSFISNLNLILIFWSFNFEVPVSSFFRDLCSFFKYYVAVSSFILDLLQIGIAVLNYEVGVSSLIIEWPLKYIFFCLIFYFELNRILKFWSFNYEVLVSCFLRDLCNLEMMLQSHLLFWTFHQKLGLLF